MVPFKRDPEGPKPLGEFLLEVGWGNVQRKASQKKKVSKSPSEKLQRERPP